MIVSIALIGGTLDWAARVAEVRERTYPIPQTQCEKDHTCEEKALQVQAREAVTAEAALQVSFYQLTLSLVGIIGVGFTVYYAHGAWLESRRSAEVAHKDFVATHRPRIRVRFFQDDSGPDGYRKAFVTFANVGETRATITAIGGGLGVRTRDTKNWYPPGINASAQGRGAPPNPVLNGGEARTYWISSSAPVTAGQLVEMINGAADLIASGEIRYADSNGTVRHTGFFWRWNPRDREFSPLDEPGQNYED